METYSKSQSGIFLFMGKWKTLAIALTLLSLVMSEAPADTVTFTHEGNGSGTLDGIPFPASDFVITAFGETGDRESHSGGWFIDHVSASISIDGLGNFDFLTGTRTFVNNGFQIVGFSRAGIDGADLFNGPTDGQFGAWDMLSPIGPISGSGGLMQWTTSPPLIDTTGGILTFDDGTCEVTFTAALSPVTLSGLVYMLQDSPDLGYSLEEDDLVYFYSFNFVQSLNTATVEWSTHMPTDWIYVDWPFYYELDLGTLWFALPPSSGIGVYHNSTGQWELLPQIIPW
jgi:hypothetical protein